MPPVFLEVFWWGFGMVLVIGGVMVLWTVADSIAEKKHKTSERLETLERWKAGIDLADAQARREEDARIEKEKQQIRLEQEEYRRQHELAAEMYIGKDEAFEQALKGLLDGD